MDEMSPADVERLLARQENALALLERLREADPLPLTDEEIAPSVLATNADPRRETARAILPPHVRLDLHDGRAWQAVPCDDIGVGGAHVSALPEWAAGPTPARLLATPPSSPAPLCLADIMWRDAAQGTAGLRFEFLSVEEQTLWAACLQTPPAEG